MCLSSKQKLEVVKIAKEVSCPLDFFPKQSGNENTGPALRMVSRATKHANAQGKNFILECSSFEMKEGSRLGLSRIKEGSWMRGMVHPFRKGSCLPTCLTYHIYRCHSIWNPKVDELRKLMAKTIIT